MPITKKREAYLRYTTFVSTRRSAAHHLQLQLVVLLPAQVVPTFVFQEVAHPRPPSEDQLCDIFDDLALLLGCQSREPLRESHLSLPRYQKDVTGLLPIK